MLKKFPSSVSCSPESVSLPDLKFSEMGLHALVYQSKQHSSASKKEGEFVFALKHLVQIYSLE